MLGLPLHDRFMNSAEAWLRRCGFADYDLNDSLFILGTVYRLVRPASVQRLYRFNLYESVESTVSGGDTLSTQYFFILL